MIYEMLLDGETLFYPGDEECVVLDPEISLKMNDAGQAKMVIPNVNPLYNKINLRKSMLTVKKNGREVFYGEVRAYERGFDMCRNLIAVGALSFLNDSRQPQHNYGNCTNLQFLTAVLNEHNSQMFSDNRKKIQVGYVTVANTSQTVTRFTDNESTLEAIRNNLIGITGGVLRLRHENNNLYLDYVNLSEYGNYCDQGIIFGENMMDYVENFSAEDVKTVIIPYGARIDDKNSEFEKRVDIKSVNNNKNYIVSSNPVIESYGYVWGTVTFDGVTDPSVLMNLGQNYLQSVQWETAVFKLTAVDLAAINTDISAIYFGDRINLQAELFGLNATYPIVEMLMKPQKPEDERIIISANIRSKKVTLTDQMSTAGEHALIKANQEILRMQQVIRAEIANIMATFAGQYGGYKLEEYDSNGLWLRTLYMDAPDKTQATNIMEFSMRGIRFSTAGYKSASDPAWKLAITIDGKIASQEIFSNIIFANLLKAGIIEDVAGVTHWNLETGDWRSGTNESSEYLRIFEGILKGYYQNSEVGYIDLSALSTYGGGATIHEAVIGSNTILNLEFITQVNFVDKRTGTVVAYIDGNGYHGQVN